MKLTPLDLATVSLEPGTVLLEASAGTGKTYTVVGLLLRLLLERRIERLDQALVVTFTVAATEELKNRLRAGLAAAHAATVNGSADPFLQQLAQRPGARDLLARALDDFDQVAVATIHGFCKRLLEESAFESHAPFALDFTADPLPLLYRAAADALRSQYDADVTARSALLHDAGFVPAELVEQYRLWQRHPDVRLEPQQPDPVARLQTLHASIQAAAPLWDGAAAASVARLRWKKDKRPFVGDASTAVSLLGQRLSGEPALVLGLLRQLAPEVAEANLLAKEVRHLAHPFFEACNAVAKAASDAELHVRADLLHRMHTRLAAHKRDEHLLTFDDLLLRTHQALHDPARRQILLPALRARYEVALIDEFQDTDSLQYDIFATCFAQRTLFLIGDPKQSIYGFRGADVGAYLAARSDAVRGHTLPANWRSSDGLVRAVNQVFAGPWAFALDGITMPHVTAAPRNAAITVDGDPGAPLRWRFLRPSAGDPPGLIARAAADERIVADVAAEIARLRRCDARIAGERVRPRDCAVLTRTNRQALEVQAALRDAGIPSVIGKAGDIFQSEELAELELFLQAVLAPRDTMRVRAAMATRFWGSTCSELQAFGDDDDALDRELERLDRWRRAWLRRGLVPMIEQVLVDLAVHKRFLAQLGGERRLTNFRQLFELLHEAEHGRRLSPEGLLEWLQRERAHQEEIDYTLRELRLESDGDAVQILTVHGSKGLEYEIVFCPFLWDGSKPRRNEVVPVGGDDGGRELAIGLTKDDPAMHRAQADRLAEDLRLCYVALTRARRRCYVHWGPIGTHQSGAWRSALAWLLAPSVPQPAHDLDGKPAANWVALFQDLAKSRAGSFEADLQARCDASDGAMAIDCVPDEPVAERLPPERPRALPPARRAIRTPVRRTTSSYSSLIAGGAAVEAAVEPMPDLADRPVPTAVPAPSRGIFAFARGPAAGQCLHQLLERVDLAQLDAPAAAQLVRTTLDAFALLAPDAHTGEIDPVGDVLQNLRDLAAARVHAGGPTVQELCGAARAVEWEFTLPAHGGSLQQLAEVLHASSSPLARAQAARLRRLPDPVLDGFLVGFVDLLAEHGGRYHVVDWKSNHLGGALGDYGPEALARVMCEHDYVLQYHLYVLALHRQLRARLPDYDYDRHVGGVCYAFLRGAAPGASSGMFHDRVPREVVLAMDRWAGGAPGGGAR